MSLETQNFEFREFLLDAREKVLLRHREPVAITPKAFLLLQTLVENHGHIVEKEQLMIAVWEGSFVEEGNLTFTVNLLRKALGDDRSNPRFIETVPRRGYRFIADVEQVPADLLSDNGASGSISESFSENTTESPKIRRVFLALAAALIPVVMVSGLWYAGINDAGGDFSVLTAPFSLEKISTNGNVLQAVVSHDGQNIVYTNGIQGKQSVWVKQLGSSNHIQILPPSDNFYYGLALSPDGNLLYFTRRTKLVERQADIFRVSIFGGIPAKVVSEAQGPISISPDGEKISYVRCYYRTDEYCSLWIADAADGKNERKLVTRPRPFRIGDHKFSPDGRSLTFTVGQSESQANEFGLVEVDIENGKERELTTQKFFNIKSLIWLPDQSGLLMAASRIPDRTFHIWHVSALNGDAEPLTKDGESYSTLSVDTAVSMLIATQIRRNFHLRIYGTDTPAEMRDLADATSVAFARDGKIIFSSARTGNHEVWSVNPDGSEERQLTSNSADDMTGAVSPNNNLIFFESNRTGEAQVWRMNADGSNQTQITANEGGFPLFVSPDGKWVYYTSALRKTLLRVSANGGDEEVVWDKRSGSFAISPDGSSVALTEREGDSVSLRIVSLDDKSIIRSFDLPADANSSVDLAWTNDGKNLTYILRNSEMQKNTLWQQPLDLGPARQIADLGDEIISEPGGFAMSPDGTSFAVVMGRWEHDAVLLKGLK